MKTKIERQSSMMMKVRRIQLLQELDQLFLKLCKRCGPVGAAKKSSCNCQSSMRIAEIGQELLELVKTPTSAILGQLDGMKFEDFTVELYLTLDELGISDLVMTNKMKVGHARFIEWKRENELTRQVETA